MTLGGGLERPPRRIAALLVEAADNLLTAANELDALVDHPSVGVRALKQCAAEERRISHDVRCCAVGTRRAGPERVHPVGLAQAVERLVEALEALGWAWTRCPLEAGAELVRTLRDGVRACAHGIEAHDDAARLLDWVAVAELRERETRRSLRATRRALLVDRANLAVGLCALRLVRQSESALAACFDVRGLLLRHAVA